MHDKDSLTSGQAHAIRLLAILFLLLCAHRTVTLVLPLTAPAYMNMIGEFDNGKMLIGPEPFALLPPEPRAQIEADKTASARYIARLNDPELRVRLFFIELIGRIPEIALKFSMGLALWHLSRREANVPSTVVRWLIRAAIAGVALAIVTPIAEMFRTGWLLTGVFPMTEYEFALNLDTLQANLLFAGGVWAAAWSIKSGLRARERLAEIV